jgi:hypothetical protein
MNAMSDFDAINARASAYLDNELSDEERLLAESDPACMAVVERFRQVSALVASPFVAPSDVREQAIASALAQLPSYSAVSVKTNRASRWLPRAGVAVGAIAAAAIGLAVISNLSGTDSKMSTEAASSLTTEVLADAAGAADAVATNDDSALAASAATTAAASQAVAGVAGSAAEKSMAVPPDLGPVTDLAEARVALGRYTDSSTGSTAAAAATTNAPAAATTTLTAAPSPTTAAAGVEGPVVPSVAPPVPNPCPYPGVIVATATWNGRPVTIFDVDGTLSVVDESCTVVASG